MRTMSAKEAKNHFGELLMEAQRAPVAIEKNGKPVGVLYSWEDHEIIEKIKFERLKAMIDEGIASIEKYGAVEMTDEDFEQLKAEARAEFERRRSA